MYAIFIRDKRQQIYSKVQVANKSEAFKKFKETIHREELYGRKLIAIITHKSVIKAFHSFAENKCDKEIIKKLEKLEKVLSIKDLI